VARDRPASRDTQAGLGDPKGTGSPLNDRALKSLWVDTDLALGTPRGDVDDGFALAAVLLAVRKRGGVRLLGISAVRGNTDARSAYGAVEALVTASLTSQCPRLVEERDAPEALAALPSGTEILALGPPTSLVKAAALDPSLPSRVSVRAVGGVLDRLRHPLLPRYCLNFRADPLATRTFFSLGFRMRRVFPLDVVRGLRFGRDDLLRIGSVSSFGAYLACHSERWLRRARLRHWSRSFPVWDLVAALDQLDCLPGARFTPDERLCAFDVAGGRRVFFDLLSAPTEDA